MTSFDYVKEFKSIIDEMIKESKITGTAIATTTISLLCGDEYYIRRFGGFLWDHRKEVVAGEWKDIITDTYEKQIAKYSCVLKIPENAMRTIILLIRDKFADYIQKDADATHEKCMKLLNLHIKWLKSQT